MTEGATIDSGVLRAADRAVRAVPPVWPLHSSVAVNPFLGQTDRDLATVSALLRRVVGVRVAMPRAWYAERIAAGEIAEKDLAEAVATVGRLDVETAKAGARREAPAPVALPTVLDLARDATGTDWPGLMADRFGLFAASHFDEGAALWAAPAPNAFAAWREMATHDLTPEIAGLSGFAQHATDAPQRAVEAIERAVDALEVPEAALDTYFHALLASLGGWSQVARHRLWQAELAGEGDRTGIQLLAIRLVWEEAAFLRFGERFRDAWRDAIEAHAAPVEPSEEDRIDATLQLAAERAVQRDLAATMAAEPSVRAEEGRPALQAAFCIDVRSEVFRRALESVDPGIQTLGFAGFFGIATSHRGFASDVREHRLPVLLNPALHSRAGGEAEADRDRRFVARTKRAWGRFKLAAVSSFAFVEAMGPVYVVRLVRDGLGLKGNAEPRDPAPVLDPSLDLDARIGAAETVLRAMSLTGSFARVVLLAGHGANVVNNPHASALHCGACGGYSGEVNARLLAQLLNDPAVRAALPERGIDLPADTLFVAGLHDTTTDAVALYDEDVDASGHADDLAAARRWLEAAGDLARAERALRLPRADGATAIAHRSRDWAETRPEWALAGCKAFIAAPRIRTSGRDLGGRAFLHDYDWHADKDFGVLELIMTAPVVVASWISLQYYGSTVAPEAFGGGNKLLHNVTGGIGVVEGNGGLLRAGLPLQSVHDGEKLAHEPLRLSVMIEAPREAMTDILRRHDGVRELFDNRWLHLFALDGEGRMAWRYAGGLEWESMDPAGEATERSLVA